MLWNSLEVPWQGASNKYPQHMFSYRNKKNIFLIPLLSGAMNCHGNRLQDYFFFYKSINKNSKAFFFHLKRVEGIQTIYFLIFPNIVLLVFIRIGSC